MKRNYRLAGYLLAAMLLIGSMANGPQAWATPRQTSSQQTVPTRTPKPGPTDPPTVATSPPPNVPSQPTVPPLPTEPPQPTARWQPTLPAATQTPTMAPPVGATPAPFLTPGAGDAALSLTIQANPSQVWAGLPVEYTLILVNQSANSVRDVNLLDVLPIALEPGGIISGDGANWRDRTLRIEKEELKPGEQLDIIFQVIVAENLPLGTIVTNQVEASASGGLQVQATADIVLPPAELPRVGGGADAGP
jgi:hypothetical protein